MDGAPQPQADAGRIAEGWPENLRRDLLRLARELQANRGRWGLFVLVYGHAGMRDRIAGAIDELEPGGLRLQVDEARHPDWPALEEAIAVASERAALVQLFGMEKWLDPHDSSGRFGLRLRAWNVRREGFAQRVHVPVLCWLRAAQVSVMATTAPDLWSWRTGVHRFDEVEAMEGTGAPSGANALLQPHLDEIDSRSLEQRLSRIDELTPYLSASHEENALRAALLDELAGLHASIGRLDDALRIRREELLPLAEQLGDERTRAITMGKIADVLQVRGDLDEALRIRREELLPVFERLGDQRSRAVTLDRIADVLQVRGDLDEALRIRRDEQLPIFERLGDAYACAVTLGKIADVLHSRGDLEADLRIRRDELLPVFERLGDERSRAVTLGRIADVLQARGDLDEALRIRREEELPVFERLGDRRARVLTLGRIADALQARGDFDEALRIHLEERLPIATQLHDIDSIAHIRYRCASIRLQMAPRDPSEVKTAMTELHEAFDLARRLGRADFIATIGETFGRLLLHFGKREPAAIALTEAQSAMRKLGRHADVATIEALLDAASTPAADPPR